MFSTQRIITWAFYTLFFFTPLFFTSLNNELFEYNKMMLVYGLTVIIVGTWILKMVQGRTLILKRTPLDIPLLLFWFSQLLSTIFSIDTHTSIWGYYSRSNGGFLSITSYILLYYALVSNFESKDVFKFLKASLLGAFLVSLYAIPEHFGVSPSCIILTGSATADCWVQDVQARVFATLGQPNWLAAYLTMLIFPLFYFLLKAKSKVLPQAGSYFFLFTFYLAFTFTYSRGGTLGFLTGLGVFILVVISSQLSVVRNKLASFQLTGKQTTEKPNSENRKQKTDNRNILELRTISVVLLTFLLINLFFGSALTRFQLIKPSALIPKVVSGSAAPSGTTQLENGGTESSQIRFIVWKGAIDIFKHYPIFGSGVETFAYSYYNFRPVEHNNVSEWDFLYNKAHNEYLNYLATTGIVGFISYIAVIVVFIVWGIRYALSVMRKKERIPHYALLITTIIASYFSYLIQNIFGFSVVVIAMFFYLFPAFAFVATDSTHSLRLPKRITYHLSRITFIYKRSLYTKIVKLLLIIITLGFLFNLTKLWLADTLYKKGSDSAELGNAGRAYNYLGAAVSLNPGEPLYHSDWGFAAASASVALFTDDATTSGKLKSEAVSETEASLRMSPANVSFWRTAIRTYYQLSNIDHSFDQKTVETLDHAIFLAPTDAKLFYNKGLVLSQIGKTKEGIAALKNAYKLRPNYFEAHFAIGEIYQAMGEKEKAKEEYSKVLLIVPNEPGTLKKREELKK